MRWLTRALWRLELRVRRADDRLLTEQGRQWEALAHQAREHPPEEEPWQLTE